MWHVIMNLGIIESIELFQNDWVREGILSAVRETGATVLRIAEHRFDPHGYTCVILLAESHASIHTFPENGEAYVDFFTCSDNHDCYGFINYILDYFKPGEVWYQVIER